LCSAVSRRLSVTPRSISLIFKPWSSYEQSAELRRPIPESVLGVGRIVTVITAPTIDPVAHCGDERIQIAIRKITRISRVIICEGVVVHSVRELMVWNRTEPCAPDPACHQPGERSWSAHSGEAALSRGLQAVDDVFGFGGIRFLLRRGQHRLALLSGASWPAGVGHRGGGRGWWARRVGVAWIDESPLSGTRIGPAVRSCAGRCPGLETARHTAVAIVRTGIVPAAAIPTPARRESDCLVMPVTLVRQPFPPTRSRPVRGRPR